MRNLTMALVVSSLIILFTTTPSNGAGEPRISPCEACRGTGKVVCTFCNGTGQAMRRLRRFRGSEQLCPKCGTSGQRLCFECGGNGTLCTYDEPSTDNVGWLKVRFEIKKKKNVPAPSWISIIVDDRNTEKIEGHGSDRVYDFREIPLAPGDRHRIKVLVHFNKGIGGFYDGIVFVHGVKIKKGLVTTTEGSKKLKIPRDEQKYEDWGEIFRGLYQDTEGNSGFSIVEHGTVGAAPVYEPDVPARPAGKTQTE
jgi:hypothetical protein